VERTKKIHKTSRFLLLIAISTLFFLSPQLAGAFTSNNIPLDSPMYRYLEKLAGFGLIESDIVGLKPYSKAEAARLVLEAEENIAKNKENVPPLAQEMLRRLRELIPREIFLRREQVSPPFFHINPFAAARFRYVYLDGVPRNYNRQVFIGGGQSAFGFIGGKLRPEDDSGIFIQSGKEGTPLLENNEGIIYGQNHNFEMRWQIEAFVTDKVSFLVEPILLSVPEEGSGDRENRIDLQKGYVKLGGGGLELEVGRDANWFGPGYRGALSLSNNAENFDFIKLSSPEPLDIGWIKRHLGYLKYSFIFSRFDETGTGDDLRQPYFIGIKMSLKPRTWFEIGVNFVRQEGGPGFAGSTSLKDFIFGGGLTNKSNSIAGIDLRFRIPWLRDTEIYAEYVGEDSALFWPFVESYVAGFFIPRLTAGGRDDLRFEFFYGNPFLYTDFKFPAGYAYRGMNPGHSQGGGGVLEFFTRYTHWFSPRINIALEYFHTERGHGGKVGDQHNEYKNACRGFLNLPVYGDFDLGLMYGWERIDNFNLVQGIHQINHLFKADLSYRY
jgi:hypothetical protein